MINKELDLLISNMQPILNDGEFVYVFVSDRNLVPRERTVFEFHEQEGVSMILHRTDADALRIDYDYIAAWITLNVNSSLQAVGFTAAFSAALTKQNVSCNVIAGFHHDHIFVDHKRGPKALAILKAMASKSQ